MKNPAFDLLVWDSLRLAPINTTHKTTHSTSLGTRSDRPGSLPAFRHEEEPGCEATKENKKKRIWDGNKKNSEHRKKKEENRNTL